VGIVFYQSDVTMPYAMPRMPDLENAVLKFLVHKIKTEQAYAEKETVQYYSEIAGVYSYLRETMGAISLEPLKFSTLFRQLEWLDILVGREEKVEADIEQRVERKVIDIFERIEQVFSIYVDEYLQRKRFLILTTNEKYEDELMDRLLITERDVRLQFKHIPLSFEYIPKLVETLGQVLNPNARLIWSRTLDGIPTSSFAASTT